MGADMRMSPLRLSRRKLLSCSLATAALSLPAQAGRITDAAGGTVSVNGAARIVSIGSSVTEIIVDLHQARRIVAIDSTSAGIDGVKGLPDVGYLRALSAEGVLSQTPDLICATSDAGPPEVIDTLRQSGLAFALIPHVPTVDGILQKIALIGTLLDSDTAAATLIEECRGKAEALAAKVRALSGPKPKVLFILSFSDGRLIAGGSHTGADSVIAMAGGSNIAAAMSGYKPLSPETLLADPPDAIVTMSGAGIAPDRQAILDYAPLASSPAALHGAIRAFDGASLLGFGPRTITAAGDLAEFLHTPAAP